MNEVNEPDLAAFFIDNLQKIIFGYPIDRITDNLMSRDKDTLDDLRSRLINMTKHRFKEYQSLTPIKRRGKNLICDDIYIMSCYQVGGKHGSIESVFRNNSKKVATMATPPRASSPPPPPSPWVQETLSLSPSQQQPQHSPTLRSHTVLDQLVAEIRSLQEHTEVLEQRSLAQNNQITELKNSSEQQELLITQLQHETTELREQNESLI